MHLEPTEYSEATCLLYRFTPPIRLPLEKAVQLFQVIRELENFYGPIEIGDVTVGVTQAAITLVDEGSLVITIINIPILTSATTSK